jgi:kynureninase
METFQNTLDFAQQLDKEDPLFSFRNEFLIPKKDGENRIYFLGNSLGLQPKNTQQAIQKILNQWESEGVESFFSQDDPWLKYHDKLVGPLSKIVGALPQEISVMNQLTVNIHLMLVSFYRPIGKKNKILVESKAFPSDQYALSSYVRHLGLNPDEVIVEINPENEGFPPTNDEVLKIIEKHKDELALIFLSGINYYTGQLFNLKAIAEAAHQIRAIVGYDLAHAAGNVQLALHEWNVDFACWCSYKYLNAGPGAIGAVFVHEKYHHEKLNRLEGWWGVKEDQRFFMKKEFIPSPDARSWQLGTSPMLLMASLHASLKIFERAGWNQLLQKQQKLIAWTDFLLGSFEQQFFERITPKQRGCQISLQFKQHGKDVYQKLFERGFMIDWREPDVIRFAPVPMYNSFSEIWQFVQALKEIINELSLKH